MRLVVISLSTLFLQLSWGNNIFQQDHAPLKEITSQTSYSGSDIGGGHLDSSYVATWCDDAVAILEDGLEAAKLTFYDSSNYYRANYTIAQAYKRAMDQVSTSPDVTVFTLQVIRQGQELMEMMKFGGMGLSDIENEVLYHFFSKQTRLIIDVVYGELDKNFYLPYMRQGHRRCYDCYDRIEDFERQFMQYATKQLKLLNDHFALSRISDRKLVIAEPDLFLQLSEYLSLAVAQTIEDSLWREAFSCTSSRLKMINHQLQQYNMGSRGRYPNDKLAAYFTYTSLNKIISEIDGC